MCWVGMRCASKMRESRKCPRLMPNGCYDDDNDDSNCLFSANDYAEE